MLLEDEVGSDQRGLELREPKMMQKKLLRQSELDVNDLLKASGYNLPVFFAWY
jgi:hypothetical protein